MGQLSLVGYNLNDDRLYISYNLFNKQARLMMSDEEESKFIPRLPAFNGRRLTQDNCDPEQQLSVLRVDSANCSPSQVAGTSEVQTPPEPASSNPSEGVDVTASGIPLSSLLSADRPVEEVIAPSIQAPSANADDYNSNPSNSKIIQTSDGQVQFVTNDSIVESIGNTGEQGNKDLETILGTDERTLVYDTTAYPFRTIGRISFMCYGFEGQCTGTLVGPHTIVTAAHCIVNSNNPQDNCTDYKFSPGQLGSAIPYGTVNVVEYKLPSSWFNQTISDNDYAIMTLEQDIGLQVGWMSFGFDCGLTVQNLTTAGYPADKDESTSMYTTKCKQLLLQACSCDGSEQEQCLEVSGSFSHTCDTYHGQSGSPLWSTERGFPQIRGIHSAGSQVVNKASYIGHIVFGFFRDFMMQN